MASRPMCGLALPQCIRVLPILLLAAAGLSGCAALHGFPERTPPPEHDFQILQPFIDAGAITGCLKEPTDTCRNQIVGARIYATDLEFSKFEERIFKQTRTGGYVATLTTLGLTAGAATADMSRP